MAVARMHCSGGNGKVIDHAAISSAICYYSQCPLKSVPDASTLWHPNIQCGVVAPPSNAAATSSSNLQEGNISDLNLAIDTSCLQHATDNSLPMSPLHLPNGDGAGVSSTINPESIRANCNPVLDSTTATQAC